MVKGLLALAMVILLMAAPVYGLVGVGEDFEPPVTNITIEGPGAGGWYTSEAEVTLLCGDGEGSGCLNTYWCNYTYMESGCEEVFYTGPFAVDSEGKNTVKFYSDDLDGNTEEPNYTAVNIDTTGPELELTITVAGEVIEGTIIPAPKAGSFALVESNVTDPGCPDLGSCTETNTIKWESTTETGVIPGEKPLTQLTYNNREFSFPPDVTSIRIWVEYSDQAGNSNSSEQFYITKHPVANFVSHSMFMVMGSSFFSRVSVRNLNTLNPVDVNLSLDDYEFAWFTGDFEGRAEDFVLEGAGRSATLVGLEPGEEAQLTIDVVAAEARQDYLTLIAESGVLIDNDRLDITTSFPPQFPELGELSIIALVVFAIFFYMRFFTVRA